MRVLWIAQNGGLYKNTDIKGTGGWIGALQSELLKNMPSLELGIVFPHKTDCDIIREGKITYIPFSTGESNNRILRGLSRLFQKPDRIEKRYLDSILSAISFYSPDIIHMWGLEQIHAVSLPHIDKPCIVHIQGLASLYRYTYCTPFFGEHDLKRCDYLLERVLLRHGQWANYKEFILRAERELRYAPYVRNWIGRTDWDYQASQLLSPGSNYYHCEEVMRSDFNQESTWAFHYKDTLNIQSNISDDWYKGIDLILKTAKLLKEKNFKFQWNIYGIEKTSKKVTYISKRLRVTPVSVNVEFHGRVNGKTIREQLLNSDVYVHPSFIENSSNAIAEAMMMGVPTIAQYVGGNPSMLRDDSGLLVAPNEPYMLAFSLMRMCDRKVAEGYSRRSIELAKRRQDTLQTVNTLIEIYEKVISSI